MDTNFLIVLMMILAAVGLIAAIVYWFLRYSFGTDQEKAEMGDLNQSKSADESNQS